MMEFRGRERGSFFSKWAKSMDNGRGVFGTFLGIKPYRKIKVTMLQITIRLCTVY